MAIGAPWARVLGNLAYVARHGTELALGHAERAARLIGAADAALELLGAHRDSGDRP